MLDPVLILVIDDIDTNLFMLSTILKREGFNVVTASSGPDGRRLALEKHPDLILLDIVMPDEDGFRTCELLKKDSETAAIPIVFLSALEDTESKVKGLAMGAADFVSKPFMKEEVLVRIRTQVRLRRNQSLLVENLGALLGSHGKNEEAPRESVFAQVNIADGICGFLCVRTTEGNEESLLAISSLKYVMPNVATPLLSPDEAVRLLSLVFRNACPGLSPMPAAYFVFNRNASRLSVTLAGDVCALFTESTSAASFCGKTGDAIAAQESLFLHRLDYPAKPGIRLCAYLSPIERDEKREEFRRLFLSTTSEPIDSQRKELAAFIDSELLVKPDDRLFVMEMV